MGKLCLLTGNFAFIYPDIFNQINRENISNPKLFLEIEKYLPVLEQVKKYYYNSHSGIVIFSNSNKPIKNKLKWLILITCYKIQHNSEIQITYFRTTKDIQTLTALCYDPNLPHLLPPDSPLHLQWQATKQSN